MRPVFIFVLVLCLVASALLVKALYRQAEPFDPVSGGFNDASGRKQVDCAEVSRGDRTAVILVFGQSMVSNESDPSGGYVPGPGVYNFNFLDGRCYAASDPLLGATDNRSSFLTRLGDLLVRRGVYDQVLLVPIGVGNTFLVQWAPGGLINPRLSAALHAMDAAHLHTDLALWQQGEAEAAQPTPDGPAWVSNFNAMVTQLRRLGMDAPIYVAQSTFCRKPGSEVIRAAQRQVVDPARGILPGPDTDVITASERFDGCHFSLSGLTAASELWFRAIAVAPRSRP